MSQVKYTVYVHTHHEELGAKQISLAEPFFSPWERPPASLPAASFICSVIWFLPAAHHQLSSPPLPPPPPPPSFLLSSCIPSLSSSLVRFKSLPISALDSSPPPPLHTVLVSLSLSFFVAHPPILLLLLTLIFHPFSILLLVYQVVFLTFLWSSQPRTQTCDDSNCSVTFTISRL